MQQLNKVSTLEVVALCCFVSEAEKRHTMSEFALCKLDVFFSRAISAAENKPTMRKYRISRYPVQKGQFPSRFTLLKWKIL